MFLSAKISNVTWCLIFIIFFIYRNNSYLLYRNRRTAGVCLPKTGHVTLIAKSVYWSINLQGTIPRVLIQSMNSRQGDLVLHDF